MSNCSIQPELALDCRNRLGESILWDDREGVLRWANIHDKEIWSWDPDSKAAPEVITLPARIGAIGLRQKGGLVIALEKGFAVLADGELKNLGEVDGALPTVRLNDGRVDPAGRFVCGGMDEASPQSPIASLYALQQSGKITKLRSGISCTNSLCWSVDGRTIYFTDMPTRKILAYDYDVESGSISNERVFASLESEPGLADGSIVDAEDCLWNAQWQGRKVVRYRPDGSVERQVNLPISNPTCMAFGGPELDTLFITSAWFLLSPEQRRAEPHAGGVFVLRPGVRGRKEHRFAG